MMHSFKPYFNELFYTRTIPRFKKALKAKNIAIQKFKSPSEKEVEDDYEVPSLSEIDELSDHGGCPHDVITYRSHIQDAELHDEGERAGSCVMSS